MKTPLITTPSAREIIVNDTNGIIIKKLDTKEITEAISRLLGDNNLKQKIQDNAETFFFEKLTWNNHIEKLEKVFEKVKK